MRRTISITSALLLLLGTAFAADNPPAKPGTESAAPPATQPAPATHEPGSVRDVPPRDPQADSSFIDLTRFYTLSMDDDVTGRYGYTLSALPKGIQTLGKTRYDVRGIVQVSSSEFAGRGIKFPVSVTGIRVGRKCQALKFLHASRWTEDNGTPIGAYVIHYANGSEVKLPIIFGVSLRDWRPMHDPTPKIDGPVLAWKGADKAGQEFLLFESEWINPDPDLEVATVDMTSSMTVAAPFLVAITAR